MMKTKTEIKKEYMKRTKVGVKSGYFSQKTDGYLDALAWVLGLSKMEKEKIIQDLIEKNRRPA